MGTEETKGVILNNINDANSRSAFGTCALMKLLVVLWRLVMLSIKITDVVQEKKGKFGTLFSVNLVSIVAILIKIHLRDFSFTLPAKFRFNMLANSFF